MSENLKIAAKILELAASDSANIQLHSAVIENGLVVELNNEDYIDDLPAIKSMEVGFDLPDTDQILVVNVGEYHSTVSSMTIEGEASVVSICLLHDAPCEPVLGLNKFELKAASDLPDLPEFCILNEDGNTIIAEFFQSVEIALPRSHICDQDEDPMAEMALPLLGEAEEIKLLLLDHRTEQGEIITTLLSQSRAPEQKSKVLEFHGVQKRVQRSVEFLA